jgi:hypothetical protein
LQRAQEVQDADPKVAYYVRLYAVDQVGHAASQQVIQMPQGTMSV